MKCFAVFPDQVGAVFVNVSMPSSSLFKNKWQIRLSEKNLERSKNPVSVVVANEGKE